jgi:hypothetical protein
VGTPELQGKIGQALALGWSITELLGRYNRYLHPDSRESRGASLTIGQLHRLTYTSHEEMAEHNTYQAYASALRISALVDSLQLQSQGSPSTSDFQTAVEDLPAAIRDYQRRDLEPEQKDHPALGKLRFWRVLEDSSCLMRAKLYSAGADLAFCFSLGGMLAELYWLLPVDHKGDFINPQNEVGKLYFKIGDAKRVLERLNDSVPLNSRICLSYTLSKWRSFTKRWRLRAEADPLQEANASRILDALGKQAANWRLIALAEKMPEHYLSQRDRVMAGTVSFIVSAIVGISVSVVVLTGLFLAGKGGVLPSILSDFQELLKSHGLKPPLDLQLEALDVFTITFGIVSALAIVTAPAVFISRLFLRALSDLRRWVFRHMVAWLAARRILVLPILRE